MQGNFSGKVSGSFLTPFDSFHIENVSWLRTFMNAKEFQDLAFDSFRVFWRRKGSLKLEVLKIASDPGLTLYVLDAKGRKDAFYMQRIWVTVPGGGRKELFKPVSFAVNERFNKRRVRRSGDGSCAGLPNCAELEPAIIIGVIGGGITGSGWGGVWDGTAGGVKNFDWGGKNRGALMPEDPCTRAQYPDERCTVYEAKPKLPPPPKPCEGYVSLKPAILAPSDGKKNYRGGTWGYVRDRGRKMHGGIDLLMSEDTDLYPPYDNGEVIGVVTKFKPNQYGTGSSRALGNYVRIRYQHPKYGTFIIYYAHLNSVNVKVGDRVNRGTIVARSGRTGNLGTERYGIRGKFLGYKEENRKYYPHVHIQVKKNGRFINPALVLPEYASSNFDMRTGISKKRPDCPELYSEGSDVRMYLNEFLYFDAPIESE